MDRVRILPGWRVLGMACVPVLSGSKFSEGFIRSIHGLFTRDIGSVGAMYGALPDIHVPYGPCMDFSLENIACTVHE